MGAAPSATGRHVGGPLPLPAGLTARDVGSTTGFLAKWAHRRFPLLDWDDLESAIDLLLTHAIRKYDPSRGASAFTWLCYYARRNLAREVQRDTRFRQTHLRQGDYEKEDSDPVHFAKARERPSRPGIAEYLACPSLSTVQRTVLYLRYQDGRTWAQVGSVVRLSGERAQQIAAASHALLRHWLVGMNMGPRKNCSDL